MIVTAKDTRKTMKNIISLTMYKYRAYIIQSLVLLITVVINYIYLSILEGQIPFGYKNFGDPFSFSCVYFFLFELIVIPINTIYLLILEKIRCNQVKIYSNKSIAIFALCFEFVFFLNKFIVDYIDKILYVISTDYLIISIGITVLSFILIDHLIISIGIIALNLIYRLNKKL